MSGGIIIGFSLLALIVYLLYKYIWPLVNPSPAPSCETDSDCNPGEKCKSGICREETIGTGTVVNIFNKEYPDVPAGVSKTSKGSELWLGRPYNAFRWDAQSSQFYLVDSDTGEDTDLCINADKGPDDGHSLKLYPCNKCTGCTDCVAGNCDCGKDSCDPNNQWKFNINNISTGVRIKPMLSKHGGGDYSWEWWGGQILLKPTDSDNYQLFKILERV